MLISRSNPKVKFYISNVRDYDSLLYVIEGADKVFQDAARVPESEIFITPGRSQWSF